MTGCEGRRQRAEATPRHHCALDQDRCTAHSNTGAARLTVRHAAGLPRVSQTVAQWPALTALSYESVRAIDYRSGWVPAQPPSRPASLGHSPRAGGKQTAQTRPPLTVVLKQLLSPTLHSCDSSQIRGRPNTVESASCNIRRVAPSHRDREHTRNSITLMLPPTHLCSVVE